MTEKQVATICVYGDFAKKDIRIKVFPVGSGTHQFAFQNILKEAGYDAELFGLSNKDFESQK